MTAHPDADQLLCVLHETIARMVSDAAPDLTTRQLGVILTVGLTQGPHTVRGLAQQLNVPKPTISRAMDRLAHLGFARRVPDPDDRRSVLLQATVEGSVFVREVRQIMADAKK